MYKIYSFSMIDLQIGLFFVGYTVLDEVPQIGVLHRGCNPLFVIDLFVD